MTTTMTVKKKAVAKRTARTGKPGLRVALTLKTTEGVRYNTLVNIFAAFGDQILLNMFRTEYIAKPNLLTRKQYYARLQLLKSLGLVTKVRRSNVTRSHAAWETRPKVEPANFVYVRTALGNVVFQIVSLLERVLTQSWRWKGLDAFNDIKEMSAEDRNNIRTSLMDDVDVQEILRVLKPTSHLVHDEEKQEKGGETGK